jgi:hypothetical protein
VEDIKCTKSGFGIYKMELGVVSWVMVLMVMVTSLWGSGQLIRTMEVNLVAANGLHRMTSCCFLRSLCFRSNFLL